MTNLIETIKIEIELNHCAGDSAVLGGERDIRAEAADYLTQMLPGWLRDRIWGETNQFGDDITIKFTNTGLMEVPEESGGDN